jgi:hypothetical protein
MSFCRTLYVLFFTTSRQIPIIGSESYLVGAQDSSLELSDWSEKLTAEIHPLLISGFYTLAWLDA